MDSKPTIIVGAINIAANPHPDGIYRRLFEHVASLEVPLHGSDWAKISAVTDLLGRDGVFVGRVLLWARINKDGSWINKKTETEASQKDKKNISIPEELEPNFRSFVFAFDEKKHRLVIEYQNEMGQKLGPRRAERLFSRLFEVENLWEDAPIVAVTVVPTEDALDRIFEIPRLRRLRIFNALPNDDLADDAERIQDRLRRMGAKSQDTELHKAPRVKKLEPDEGIKKLAAAAASDGFVEGEGRDGAGKNVFESTKDHPKTVAIKIEGEATFSAFLSAMRALL